MKWHYLLAWTLWMAAGYGLNVFAQAAPSITTSPTSRTNLAGTTATFSVGVHGTGPFTYQWIFNGISLSNDIATVAGNGRAAFAGDGGTAASASLWGPQSLALDNSGDLYIADTRNDRVRKVDTHGNITTFVGSRQNRRDSLAPAADTRLSQPGAVVFDAAGNAYISDSGNSRILKVDIHGILTTIAGTGRPGYSGDHGPATSVVLQ